MLMKRLRQMLAALAICALLTCALPATASAAFHDVPAGHWAAAEIHRCVEKGFFQGQSATSFGLGQSMTRAAAAVVLCRFFGWETPAVTESSYSDVPAGDWYAAAVESALSHGALTLQRDVFRPADSVTREELTVMLVRALGYAPLAGTVQDDLPFADVTTNTGYISLAYRLGLMNGTSAEAFSPSRPATREQVAVILMRLYDKLNAPVERAAILNTADLSPDLTGFDVAAIPAARLTCTNEPTLHMMLTEEAAAPLFAAADAAGASKLLYVTGGSSGLDGKTAPTAKVLAEAVAAGGYDGLLLEFSRQNLSKSAALTRLVSALRTELAGKPLWLLLDAPARDEKAPLWDYAALGAQADRLLLRAAPDLDTSGAIVVAPVDPLEQVYHALTQTGAKNVSLLLTAHGSVWSGKNHHPSMTGKAVAARAAEADVAEGYSARHACAYLYGTGKENRDEVVWYLNDTAVAARLQFLRLSGGQALCVSDLSAASHELLAAVR